MMMGMEVEVAGYTQIPVFRLLFSFFQRIHVEDLIISLTFFGSWVLYNIQQRDKNDSIYYEFMFVKGCYLEPSDLYNII